VVDVVDAVDLVDVHWSPLRPPEPRWGHRSRDGVRPSFYRSPFCWPRPLTTSISIGASTTSRQGSRRR